jgi:hypothetical protein
MIVFYSWQSWLSTNTNRNFIQKAIQKALAAVVKEEQFLKLDASIEKDTENVTGSPDITDTIFAKIRECDVFIGDITPITVDKNGNKIPNPNVLVELGYAASELGWDRIICILNTAHGNIEALPFDIRQHRIATYFLTEDMGEEERSKQNKLLSSSIAASLQSIERRFLPDIQYLNSQIVHSIYPIRICTPIIFWAFEQTDENSDEEEFVFILLQRLIDDAKRASDRELPKLLAENSHALTSRQKKRCREIAKVSHEISTKVGSYLMLWDMHKRHSQKLNIEMKYSRREYMTKAIKLLKLLYESKWFNIFDNLDNKYRPGPDDYLFGKKPLSKEQEQALNDKLYELQGKSFESREEFDTLIEFPLDEEFDPSEILAFNSIYAVYRDRKLADHVWEFIKLLKEH